MLTMFPATRIRFIGPLPFRYTVYGRIRSAPIVPPCKKR